MEKKYDLNWIVEHVDKQWIVENPDTVMELLKWMNSELRNRKEYIQSIRREELLRAALNS